MSKIVIFSLFVAFVLLFPIEIESQKRYCGQVLTDSLALICDGQYNNLMPSSRGKRSWSQRKGVFDECCKVPCSMKTLKSYCNNSKGKK